MPRWTASARKRQRELIKKWKPWNNSTGPRTEEGKEISSQNARKYSQEIQTLLEYVKQTEATMKKLDKHLREELQADLQLTDDD